MGKYEVKQFPINTYEAGIYIWRYLDPMAPLQGHVISMGGQTTKNSKLTVDPGHEAWFVEGGTNRDRELRAEISVTGSPEELAEQIAYIEENEEQFATAPIVPSWTSSWEIPSGASLYTVTEVHWEGGGSTRPVDVVERFSLLFLENGTLVAPRWFRPSGLGVSNIFGFPDAEPFTLTAGSYVVFSPISSTSAGYPQASSWEATTTS